ncbi:hypothetical protein JCM8097_000385 [Rhodosporidiobolus ruineniae]
MTACKRPLPGDFALLPPTRPPTLLRRYLLTSRFAQPFTAQTALRAHHSCVNALTISADGRWLASGGDDMRVLLWDTADDGSGTGQARDPVGCFQGAKSNIFSISFSCDGSKVFSAGNDTAILCHDLETASSSFPTPLHNGARPTDVWLDHDDSVMSVACHPSNPALFLSASSDGTLHLYDTRTEPGSIGLLAAQFSIDDVTHHPLTPDVFAYSGENAQVGLVDGRMAWSDSGAGNGRTARIVNEVAVQEFDACLARRQPEAMEDKPPDRAHPTVSSAVFSPSGSLLCTTLSGHLPTLYELSSPTPLATFSSPPSPTPASSTSTGPTRGLDLFPRGYRNTCTTKHGSFGGGPGAAPGSGLYYGAGSDDFKAYVWEVPSVERMREQRREVAMSELSGMGYSSSSSPNTTILPASISTSSSILTGHRSIVNTALFHPTLPILYTSGVEKVIVRHSPASSSSSTLLAAPSDTLSSSTTSPPKPAWEFRSRPIASHLRHPGLSGRSDAALDPSLRAGESEYDRELRLREEDRDVLEYFDGLVENEGDEAVWDEEGRRFGDDSSDDEDGGETGAERTARAVAALRRVLADAPEDVAIRPPVPGEPSESEADAAARRVRQVKYVVRYVLMRGIDEDDDEEDAPDVEDAVEQVFVSLCGDVEREGGGSLGSERWVEAAMTALAALYRGVEEHEVIKTDDEADEEETERVEAEGEDGTVRRILTSIYALEEEQGRSSDEEEEEESSEAASDV